MVYVLPARLASIILSYRETRDDRRTGRALGEALGQVGWGEEVCDGPVCDWRLVLPVHEG